MNLGWECITCGCAMFIGMWAGVQAGMKIQAEKTYKWLTRSQRLEVDNLQLRQSLSHTKAELEAYGHVEDMASSPYRGSQPDQYTSTEFPSIAAYRAYARGEMTVQEFSSLTADDLRPITRIHNGVPGPLPPKKIRK